MKLLPCILVGICMLTGLRDGMEMKKWQGNKKYGKGIKKMAWE